MSKITQNILWVFAIIFVVSLVFNARTCNTMVGVVSDTTRVTIYDTIKVVKPIAKDSVVVRYVTEYVRVTDTIIDSIKVQIPITQKVYEDSTYKAYVSGYKPSLDSIFVYPKTEVQTITNKVNDRSRWSVSVHAGYGLTLTKQPTFSPYVGIGLSYNLYTFPRIGKRIKEKLNK